MKLRVRRKKEQTILVGVYQSFFLVEYRAKAFPREEWRLVRSFRTLSEAKRFIEIYNSLKKGKCKNRRLWTTIHSKTSSRG